MLGLLFAHGAMAQFIYKPATELTLGGKMMPTQNPFHRVDTVDHPDLPARMKQLFTHGTGMYIAFKTNSTAISAKWCVTAARPLPYLTPIANKGFDIYVKKQGKWQFAGVAAPTGICSTKTLVENMEEGEKEFIMYLPVYDEIRSLEIGVKPGAIIEPIPEPFKKRVLIYGSSIVQGAGTSRPGMAYPAQLSRQTGLNFINFGLSGMAKMEKEVADIVASVDADAYILDCVPNSAPSEIKERTKYLLQTIREKHPKAPIIVMQSVIRESSYVNQRVAKYVRDQNTMIDRETMSLTNKGMKDVYFITSEKFIGDDHEGSIDGTHPNDLGYYRMATFLNGELTKILKKYNIN
ncbi:hydrolase [Pedobacter sp. BS3]|nr:hydrolase [Pedobacter sp. BS3]